MDDIGECQQRLELARDRLRLVRLGPAYTRKPGDLEDYVAAKNEVLALERRVAAAKGEEYAEALDFPVQWSAGAPLPHLLRNDYRALLAFVLDDPDPDWDGTYVKVMDPAREEVWHLALVEFEHCTAAKLGSPDDEVFAGHPLHGKGFDGYSAQRVVNSEWLQAVQKINSIHPDYRPERWSDLQHFIFWFHDSTFECLARGFKVETYRVSMRDLLVMMVERCVSG